MNSINAIDGLSSKTQDNTPKVPTVNGSRNGNGSSPVPSRVKVPVKVKDVAKARTADLVDVSDEYTGDDASDSSTGLVASLKREFLSALKSHARSTETLQGVIGRLIGANVEPDTMVEWGTDAGYSESYCRSVVSSILRAQGVSRRAKGAGRKVSKDAESLLAYARKAFGDEAGKMLLAAYRLSVKQDKATAKASK